MKGQNFFFKLDDIMKIIFLDYEIIEFLISHEFILCRVIEVNKILIFSSFFPLRKIVLMRHNNKIQVGMVEFSLLFIYVSLSLI